MNIREIGAYLKIKGEIDEKTRALIEEIYVEAEKTPLIKRVAEFRMELADNGVKMSGSDVVLTGNLAKKHFVGCEKIVVVLASLGLESERKMKEFYALSPTRGLVLDACYSELLERRLDKIEDELKKNGQNLTSRISCGYGDLPLETQEPIMELLNARALGIYMNESKMLTPNKSVVALLGVKGE